MKRWALYLTFGSAASILFSIALSQLLLGAALALLLFSRSPVRFPPILLPLTLLFGWTLVSYVSASNWAAGFPQIKKFFVFAIALAVCSCFRGLGDVITLLWLWAGIGLASACAAFFQLWIRYQQARTERANYYEYFLDARLHGLAGHWMTFGGELMIIAVLMLAAGIWGKNRAFRVAAMLCFVVLWGAIALGLTRGVFLVGLPLGAAYLLFSWKRHTVIIIPVILLITALLLPFQVRERLVSVFQPHGSDDSNSRRVILFRTGLKMVLKHPLLGVGPGQVGPRFLSYVPLDIPRPLPKGWYGHLHNVYLQFAAERGTPALILLLWMLLRILRDMLRETRGAQDNAWIFRGAVAVTLAVMGEGFFEHNLGDSEVLTMFLVAISCGYVVAERTFDGLDRGGSRL